jgi:hypothetical protein
LQVKTNQIKQKEKSQKPLQFLAFLEKSALGELRRATGGFETVLREFLSCFSLIFWAFPAFCFSVIRYADHKNCPDSL